MDPDFLVSAIAILFLSLISAWVLWLGIDAVRSRSIVRRSVEAEHKFLQARVAQIMAQKDFEKEKKELSWNGYRKFEVTERRDEGGDITSFILRPHDKKNLPPFHPGQYLTFSLADGNWSKPLIRCYSLSDCHRPDCYRVSIKRIDGNPDIPKSHPGRVSNHFHQMIQPGAIVDVKAPSGQFYLDITKSPPIVLIAGGVGLTPLLSMLNAVAETGSKREVWLFYGVRDGFHHIMREHLAQLALENENINLRVCYSSPRPDDAEGRDYHHQGRVTIDLLKAELPSSNYRYFICGPANMMKQMTADLKAWGVPANHINYEAFGAATVKNVAATAIEKPATALKVEFTRSGKVLDWDYESESLLDFAESHGIPIDSGCRAGNCGTCLTAVKSGDVDYVTEPGEPPETGSCLTCISVPKADLKLDA